MYLIVIIRLLTWYFACYHGVVWTRLSEPLSMQRTLVCLSVADVGSSSVTPTDDVCHDHGVGVSSSDDVSTPNTPSLDAYKVDGYSDGDPMYEGELTLLTLSGKAERIPFDHVSSYGWLLHRATEFWNKNTSSSVPAMVADIQIGFCLRGKTYVVQTQGKTSRSQVCKLYRDFKEEVVGAASVQCTVIRKDAHISPQL